MTNHNKIQGNATETGTERFSKRHPELIAPFKHLGKTDLVTAPVGFGSYRVDVRIADHHSSLAKAIRMGVNLIDTSTNYSDGNSERLVGEVLRSLIEKNEIQRDEIILVTKAGYIQGVNYDRMSARMNELGEEHPKERTELAEVVKYQQGLWHCIHPDFLKDQISRSLERLGIETIDVFLLHNPEYYLQFAVRENIPDDEAQEIYYQRIRRAFEYLETEVVSGRIKWYGVSSNTFIRPEGAGDRTSLETLHKIAGAHFGVVQMPMNLFERGALLEKNQKRSTVSALEYAGQENIGVLINRPLNAIVDRKLFRLADYPEREYPPEEDIDVLIHDIALQEKEFKESVIPQLELREQIIDAIDKLLGFGKWLDNSQWRHLAGVEEWRELLFSVIKPRIQYVYDLLRQSSKLNKELFSFLEEYAETLDEAIEHITNYYLTRANASAAEIHSKLDTLLSSEFHSLSLSQKSILLLRSIQAVSSVLVGMRSEEYVEDVMYGLYAKPIDSVEEIWHQIAIPTV